MAGSTISGTITSTVTLGNASYPSPLTVAATGDVTISAYGATGIYAPASSGTLINDGAVVGGAGTSADDGMVGGIGVSLRTGSTATNDGTITGGAGGNSAPIGFGGSGGAGVYLATGAALTNQATIIGGGGGPSDGGTDRIGGPGGAGVILNGGSLANSGTITGGSEGSGGESGRGGDGANVLSGMLTNTGTIIGGSAVRDFGFGGVGVRLAASGTLLNNGTIIGRGDGIYLETGGTLTITGVVIGLGGYGVNAEDANSLDNQGTVIGGIELAAGTLTNEATITGGQYGRVGVDLTNGSVLINDGTVIGGTGSAGYLYFPPGGSPVLIPAVTGGVGAELRSGSTATNGGTIAGGAGGAGSSETGDGAAGGTGVDLQSGSAATNDGTITGGAGGAGGARSGNGGAGAYLGVGASLTNQAAITGGAGGTVLDYFPEIGDGGTGGTGVSLLGGTATNDGTITGGAGGGGQANGDNGDGGVGVYLAAGAALTNNAGALIRGGSGYYNVTGLFGNQASGGAGVLLKGGILTNSGAIFGGYDGTGYGRNGGDGAYVLGGTLTNTGTIAGGNESHYFGVISSNPRIGDGVYLSATATLFNTGTVIGGGGVFGYSGIALAAGGTLAISGVVIGGAATFRSRGVVGTGGAGIYLAFGGSLDNTGTVIGGAGRTAGVGIDMVHFDTLNNAAFITGGVGTYYPTFVGKGGDGVDMSDGGMLTNDAGATITGGGAGSGSVFGAIGGGGVRLGTSNLSSTFVNAGIVAGGDGETVAPGGTASLLLPSTTVAGGAGIYVGAADTLINNSTVIGGAGLHVGAGDRFINKGILTGGDGVLVASGGTVFNTGTVVSGVGVDLAAGATLITSGTVSGGVYAGVTADAVMFAAAGTLAIDPGASFVGQVVGNSGFTDVLYLTDYQPGPGTLSGIGTQFVDFSQITIGSSASWTLSGANTIASGATLTELSGATLTDTGTLANYGSIVLDPSTMIVAALTGSGPVMIDAGSTLDVQGTISGGETMVFGGSGAYLHLRAPDDVSGSVTNFTFGEAIALFGVDPSSVSYFSGQLTFSGGDIPLALANGGTVHASASADGAEVFVTLCFCANTLILTPTGERTVQDLAVGDLVTTYRGEARPIVWIGVGKVLTTRGQRTAATPVIVHRGALAENVPHRDLRVTRGHALWFGGALIPAEFLVNHRSIEWDDMAQEVSLYHLELATHDVLVANGASAESYRDDGNRWLFRNANSGWGLPLQVPCAPVLTGGPFVDTVWRRLLDRSGPRPGFALTDDPDLHLLVDGARLDACERRGTAYVFGLAGRPGSVRQGLVRPGLVRIVSRAGAPAELGVARDPRVLGVAVRRIVLRQGARFRVVEAAELAEGGGFYPFEQGDGVRWTDGDAVLPAGLLSGFEGAMEVVLHLGGTTRYPLLGAGDCRAVAA